MAYKYFKNKPITLPYQDAYIRKNYPSFTYQKYGHWIGTLQPSPLSIEYKVGIVYAIGKLPKSYVLSPELRSYDEKIKIPHTYEDENGPRPCLFLPRNKEWTSNKLISDTIIPWLSLWLFYYEVWFSTGEWLGEGFHPSSDKDETDHSQT